MISLDQVQMLEKKVEVVLTKITELQNQNNLLSEKNKALEEKNVLLIQKISTFEADQNRIEQGILHALDRLDSMENTVLKTGSNANTNETNQNKITSQVQQNNSTEQTVSESILSQDDLTETPQNNDDLGLDFNLDSTDDKQDQIPDIF